MSGKEFEESRSIRDGSEEQKADNLDAFRSGQLEGQSLKPAERQGQVDVLDMGLDDPLAGKKVEAAKADYEKYSDISRTFRSASDDDLAQKLAELKDKPFAEQLAYANRLADYMEATKRYMDALS